MEFVGEHYDRCFILTKMTIYHMLVTFKDLLGWTNKIKLKKALHAHASRHYDITPSEVDYIVNVRGPLCSSYTEEGLGQLFLPFTNSAILEWVT